MKVYRLLAVFMAVLGLAGASVGAMFAASPAQLADDQSSNDASDAPATKPYLGIHVAPLNDRQKERLELPEDVEGLLVVKVDEDGPAATAGIERHSVITHINGDDVDEVKELREVLAELTPGSEITVTVYQNGSSSDVVVTVGEKPVREKPKKSMRDRLFHGISGLVHGHRNVIDGQIRTMDEDGNVHTHKATTGKVTEVGDASLTIETINGETYTAQVGEDVKVVKNGKKAELADLELEDKATIVELDGVVKAIVVGKAKHDRPAAKKRPLPPQAEERIREARERIRERDDDRRRGLPGLENRFRQFQHEVDRRFDRLERLHRSNEGGQHAEQPASPA